MTDTLSFTFVWTIKNFNLSHAWPTDRPIKSPEFYVVERGCRFWLQMYPGGEHQSPNNVELYLICLSSVECGTVDYELSFLSDDETPHLAHRSETLIRFEKTCRMENCPTREEVFVTKRSVFLPENTLKVRCRMRTPWNINVKPSIAYAIGDIFVEKITTAFCIPNFSMFGVFGQHSVGSKFPFSPCNTLNLTLTLSGNASKIEEAGVDLKVTTNLKSDACQLTLMNKFGKEVKSQHINRKDPKGQYSFENFISRQRVVEKEEEFLPGITLPIVCDLFTFNYSTTLKRFSNETQLDRSFANFESETPGLKSLRLSKSLTSSSDPLSLNILQQDLLSLYTERKLCDFELRTEDTSFPVHKNILAARSPVFEALFTSDMREVASGVQEVPDIDKGTLDRMLLYVYSGVVREFQWEEAVKLYYAADKYQILSLMQKCSSYLQNNVHGSNVCEALELADRHGDQALNSAVEEFLLDHPEVTYSSEEWSMLRKRNPQLAAETMCKMFSRVTIRRK